MVVTSTQIPHIVRRVIGQAMGIGWGSIRVIKPYIGGGFGNKQEVLYEPLNAWLTTQVGAGASGWTCPGRRPSRTPAPATPSPSTWRRRWTATCA